MTPSALSILIASYPAPCLAVDGAETYRAVNRCGFVPSASPAASLPLLRIPQTPTAPPSPTAGVPSQRQSFTLKINPLARFSHSG